MNSGLPFSFNSYKIGPCRYISIAALPPQPTWNIHGFNTSQTSLIVDWSNVPGSLEVDFFILSMNQTRPNYKWDERKTSFLRIVNSTTMSMNVSNLPVFSQYTVRVYLVDVDGDVYQSELIVVETGEGGKLILFVCLFVCLFFFCFFFILPKP